MRTRRIAVSAAAFVIAGILGACSNDSSTSASTKDSVAKATPNNANCPYTGKPVNASVTRAYKGQNVGFCCAGCAGNWDRRVKWATVTSWCRTWTKAACALYGSTTSCPC